MKNKIGPSFSSKHKQKKRDMNHHKNHGQIDHLQTWIFDSVYPQSLVQIEEGITIEGKEKK